jgi:hypothetical protein
MNDGAPETFGFYFSHALQIARGTYKVIFPKGVEAYYEPAGFQQPHPDNSVQGGRNQDGRFEVVLTVENLPVDTHIDMRLQRKA